MSMGAVLGIAGSASTKSKPKNYTKAVAMNFGLEEKTVAKSGPIRMVAECVAGGLGSTIFTVRAETSVDGAFMGSASQNGSDDHVGENDTYLNTNTPANERVIFSFGNGASGYELAQSLTNGAWVMGPEGKHYIGFVADGSAVYLNSFPRKCALRGVLMVSRK